MNLDVQNKHMKHRCCFISTLCSLSLFTWYNNCSSSDTVSMSIPPTHDDNDYRHPRFHHLTPQYLNCLFMAFYLCWDMYHMTLSSNRRILFRTDLIIHHVVTLKTILYYINHIPLEISKTIIMECISLMNYTWRDNKKKLNLYRTFCILFVRMPLSFFFMLYKRNTIVTFPYTQINGYWFFIFYDAFILWKIYKPKKFIK
jgi:hypothetical protein